MKIPRTSRSEIGLALAEPLSVWGSHTKWLPLFDEFGFLNVIVKPGVYKHYKRFIHTTALIIVEGVLQREGAVTNVIVQRFMVFQTKRLAQE
jgi:hypothetical protein